MDAHAIEVGAGAVAIAVLSGFGGAYLGARMTTRHDRIERARTRRIEAADDLIQAWADALFAIDAAINDTAPQGTALASVWIAKARELINKAVALSARVDLLFTVVGLGATNGNALRDQARAAVAAVETRALIRARQQHANASLRMAWLVNTAAEAIESTGTKRDVARRLKEVTEEPTADPANR